MKKIFLLLMLPLLALTLNSCSKDDGGDDGGNSSGKLVKTINYEYSDGDFTESYTFAYDDKQRVTEVVWKSLGESPSTESYAYANNSISHNYGEAIVKYTTDNNGYVTHEERYRDGVLDKSDIHSYTDGYISKTETTTEENENYTPIYIWTNGNLTQIDDDDELYTIAYNNVENKLNLNIFEVLVIDYPFMEEFLKFKGSVSKNYPASLTFTYNRPETETKTTHFSYIYDKDNYPTEITSTDTGDEDQLKIGITYY